MHILFSCWSVKYHFRYKREERENNWPDNHSFVCMRIYIYAICSDMKINVKLTAHGVRRLKERCGVGKGSALKFTNKVYERGLRPDELNGALRGYVAGLYHYNNRANNVRLYGDKAYIFCKNVLITVYRIPDYHMDQVRDCMQKRVDKDAMRLRRNIQSNKCD